MFERLRRREGERDAPRERERVADDRPAARGGVAAADHEARARDEFGGFNIGAAFFGWLVAIGMSVILIAIVSAAGAAIGLTEVSGGEVSGATDTVSIVGAIIVLAILFLAYYCGGYVAGRMSRFDGARQGVGVWLMGLVLTILLAVAGAIFGSEYNVLERLELPRIPVEEGDLATGGLIALLVWVIATLLGAILGGKLGERYHRKVDTAFGR